MEKNLIKKAQKGDKEAFEQLIKKYKDDLYRIARARLGDKEDDICDALQETILSAYLTIDNLKKISSFKAWLIKILINKCNDIFRKNNLHGNISLEANKCENYIYILEDIDSKLEIDNIMKRLTIEERTIMMLYYVDGYNSKEIAKMTDSNASTVRTKILRAKKKIENIRKEEIEI